MRTDRATLPEPIGKRIAIQKIIGASKAHGRKSAAARHTARPHSCSAIAHNCPANREPNRRIRPEMVR